MEACGDQRGRGTRRRGTLESEDLITGGQRPEDAFGEVAAAEGRAEAREDLPRVGWGMPFMG